MAQKRIHCYFIDCTLSLPLSFQRVVLVLIYTAEIICWERVTEQKLMHIDEKYRLTDEIESPRLRGGGLDIGLYWKVWSILLYCYLSTIHSCALPSSLPQKDTTTTTTKNKSQKHDIRLRGRDFGRELSRKVQDILLYSYLSTFLSFTPPSSPKKKKNPPNMAEFLCVSSVYN